MRNAAEQELTQAPFDVLLDSCTFHCMSDEQWRRYAATLARMARPGGGLLYIACMSEQETRAGGPRCVGPGRRGVHGTRPSVSSLSRAGLTGMGYNSGGSGWPACVLGGEAT